MNILDDVEAYTRLKQSFDSHYSKVNADEIVKKGEIVHHLQRVKSEAIEEAQRLLNEHQEHSKKIISEHQVSVESSRKLIDDHRNEATATLNSVRQEASAASAANAKSLEDYKKSMEDYKRAVERTFDEHRKAIEERQKHIDEQRKVFDDNKKLTDERIEKLVKLFLSINK